MVWDSAEILISTVLGVTTAFIGSMPVAGPLAVLVLQRTLTGQRMSAVLVALGGGMVEGSYALGIALGLPLLIQQSAVLIPVSQGLGAVVIAGLGLSLSFRPHLFDSTGHQGKRRSVLAGVAVTALNPTLLASWTLVISTLYAHGWLGLERKSAVPFAFGVTLGTTLWFSLMVWVGARFDRFMNSQRRWLLMRLIGLLLLGTGLYLGGVFIRTLFWI